MCNYDIFVAKTRNYDIFVAKMRNYDIFVAKIYDYALIDSFWGFPRFIDSLTSYATLRQGGAVDVFLEIKSTSSQYWS